MKNPVLVFAVCAGVAGAARAQQFVLTPGQLEFRIVADSAAVAPGNSVVQLALQTRYVGSDMRATSLLAARGRIASGESDGAGVLGRSSVRQAPFGNVDFGVASRRGMTEGHRELFQGGLANNNSDANGGNPEVPSVRNPHNGDGEFRWAPGLAGFGHLLAFDNVTTGVGRSDDNGADGALISVGLIDDNNGSGDDTGIEPTDGIATDQARWDTIFLFTYTVTDFTAREISFDYQSYGSTAYPGEPPEDSMFWFDASIGFPRGSNVVAGTFRDDLSDNIVVAPAPGGMALVGLGILGAARRRRG